MRLIDADALLRPISCYDPVKYTYEYGDVVTVQDIKSIPAIDAVPVVRCKDCRWSRGFATFACPMVGRVNLKDDDFCSRGERRANETD